MQLKIGGQLQPILGTISLQLSDNLGSNGIGGFMESFRATRPCRVCLGVSADFQEKVIF